MTDTKHICSIKNTAWRRSPNVGQLQFKMFSTVLARDIELIQQAVGVPAYLRSLLFFILSGTRHSRTTSMKIFVDSLRRSLCAEGRLTSTHEGNCLMFGKSQ
jgi:hypothetical protein